MATLVTESSEPSPLFSLSIDPVTKAHLSEAARWAWFLAITGLVFIGLLVVGGIGYSIWIASMVSQLEGDTSYRYGFSASLGIGSALLFIIVAVVGFFPSLFLLRFANRLKKALCGNDQAAINSSFQNLKIYFRYLGIVTIIGLVLWVLWILLLIIGLAVS